MAVSQTIPTLFLVSAGVACLTCFSRPDYNLPLMAFAYLTWDHKHVSPQPNTINIQKSQQKNRVFYLMGFSGIIDILWILIWGIFWNDKKYYPDGYWENTIHSFVLVLSIINFIIKVSRFDQEIP